MSAPNPAQRLQLFLAAFLLFLDGSFFALSVFAVPSAHAAPAARPLPDAWATAMSLMSLVSIPFMFIGATYLNNGVAPAPDSSPLPPGLSKTARVRTLGLLAAATVGSLLVAAPGIKNGHASLVIFAVAAQGVPFYIVFLIALELLGAWAPRNPGFAMGAGQMVAGLGTICFTVLYDRLITSGGCINAIYLGTVLLIALIALTSLFIEWPSSSLPDISDREAGHYASAPASPDEFPGNVLPWYHIVQRARFWHYVFVTITSQTGFVFIPYYFKVGLSFARPMDVLVRSFEMSFLVAALTRPFAGLLSDALKSGQGQLSMGSKNTMSLLLFLQAALFLLLIPVSNAASYTGLVVIVALIYIMFSTGECVSPVLARDMFSPANSSLVFGGGGSLAYGLGEVLSTRMMAIVVPSDSNGNSPPSSYNRYYFICFLWTMAGLAASLMLSKCPEAFEVRGKSTERERLLGECIEATSLKSASPEQDETVVSAQTRPT